ncbi:MAG TPA: hypothetical protein DCZ51_01790 [Bacteroidales bacterium]|jgi:UDP-N-acetylglucosamine 2-epimerase (non-hydrolysing)|nr:hypothetical protein [Bacteroidales bacterium]
MKIDLIADANPNFMKIAPIIDAINAEKTEDKNISFRLVYNGQHYDKNMSESFLNSWEYFCRMLILMPSQ